MSVPWRGVLPLAILPSVVMSALSSLGLSVTRGTAHAASEKSRGGGRVAIGHVGVSGAGAPVSARDARRELCENAGGKNVRTSRRGSTLVLG